MTVSRSRTRRIGKVVSTLTVMLLGSAVASPVAAAETPTEIAGWTESAGDTHSIRALSASEIRSRGLNHHIDMSTHAVTSPRIISTAKMPEVSRQPPHGVPAAAASGCWEYTFGYGRFTYPQMWGRTDVTWCGNGSFVTYANSSCYGFTNYATYEYLGCNNFPNYGAGYNLYRVKTQWDLCVIWVPVWGSCLSHDRSWRRWDFLGNGYALITGAGSG